MNSDTNEICGDCGATMTISTGPGRLRSYRGEGGYEMPAKLSFLACGNCGAEWMTASQIDELSDAFELQRASRRAARLPSLITFSEEGDYPARSANQSAVPFQSA